MSTVYLLQEEAKSEAKRKAVEAASEESAAKKKKQGHSEIAKKEDLVSDVRHSAFCFKY
jgi:hypothetical protein